MSLSALSNYERGIRARNAVWAGFFLLGITGMAWIPRIPEMKTSLGLSDGQFGLLLLASTLGAVPGAQLSGRIVHMYSSKIVVRISGVTLPLGVGMMGISETVALLGVGLFICGFSVAFMDVALNGQAVAIEEHTKGRWMSSFHGLWSVGAFFAALLGGLVANFVSPMVNLVVISTLSFFAYFWVNYNLLPPHLDGHLGDEGEELESKVPLKGKEAMIAMIASRLLGDRFFEKWGHVKTVQYGGFFGGGIWGLSLMIGIPLADSHQMASLVIVCIGFGAAGFGMGPFFPAFNLAAASIPGVAPSVGLARIGLIAIGSYFAGPTIIGGIAEVTSLPIAFAFPVLLMFGAAYQSRFITVKRLSHEN